MIDQHLKFLLVEDEITDAVLIQRQIEKCVAGTEIRVTDKLLSFRHALKTFIPDIVMTDYDLVGFNGIDVINNLEEVYPNTPVIVCTGTLNSEELAANIILKGAAGFLLKSDINNLHKRLEPILKEVLNNKKKIFARLEKERQQREELNRIHTILKNAASADEQDEKTKEYYQKALTEIADRLPSIMK
ncbi:response regulator [Nonlabens xiamenensis]|uniref:response regulator n=1 Tax=Nonlabens xiamenensis TaxID=2341043 RepID=UPI000F604B95|nr:response regulator [Nonlabens xiamenensis]